MRSQLGNIKTSLLAYKHHPDTLNQEELPLLLKQQKKKASQVGGTQTTPPPSPKKSTATGGTQTSPPKSNSHRQVDQDQLDHNQEGQPANTTSSKGKKTKKSTSNAPLHPGPSTGPSVGPRNNFTSRNLGTGRPTIQCTACGEYSH